MAMGRAHVRYTGHVQGVGFRYSVHRLASDFPVCGYVMNLPDGSVEVVAEGRREDVQSFLDAVSASRLADYVRGMDTDWSKPNGAFTDFQIRTGPR